jgi:omega-6 fatty acid desaturase (delta-12 desaturase)
MVLPDRAAARPDDDPIADTPGLNAALARYAVPIARQSLGQLAVAVALFLGSWAAAYWALQVSLVLALALMVLAAGFMIRVFIIQHDCGHGSFFRSARANGAAGLLCSLITLTPFASWRRQHAAHHGNWNNLDRRGSGLDIYSDCRTVREYRLLSPLRRLGYRLVRHPVVANLIFPPLIFLLLYRLPFDMPKAWRRERRSIHATTLAIIALAVGAGALLGFGRVVLVELTILTMASIGGVWLFTLQHKFDGAQWAHQAEWSLASASLGGTSCLRLPVVLQWFTGNIGFHHIHHLNPRVPNYRLQAVSEAMPALRPATTLDLFGGLRAVRYVLWDEDQARLVRFCDVV